MDNSGRRESAPSVPSREGLKEALAELKEVPVGAFLLNPLAVRTMEELLGVSRLLTRTVHAYKDATLTYEEFSRMDFEEFVTAVKEKIGTTTIELRRINNGGPRSADVMLRLMQAFNLISEENPLDQWTEKWSTTKGVPKS